MTKPTIVQTVLRRPSRKYHFPEEKKTYYSSKQEVLRSLQQEEAEVEAEDKNGTLYLPTLSARPSPTLSPTSSSHSQDTVLAGNNDNSDESDDSQAFYTPHSSPRSSGIVMAAAATATISTSSLSSTLSNSQSGYTSSTYIASTEPSDFYTPLPLPVKRRSSVASSRSSIVSVNYSDEDWAKDVRWLVPPSPQLSPKRASTTPAPIPSQALSVSERKKNTRAKTDSSIPPPSSPSKPAYRSSKLSKPPTTLRSMTAVLEEEEDSNSSDISSMLYSTRDSGIMASQQPSSLRRRSTSAGASEHAGDLGRYPRSAPAFSSASTSTSTRQSRPGITRRRSRSLEGRPNHPRAATVDGSTTTSTSLISDTYTSTSSALPSNGTPGYTSLTLPRAPPTSQTLATSNRRSMLIKSGKVDLTTNGLAQATMASVEVVRGLGEKASSRLGRNWFKSRRKANKSRLTSASSVSLALSSALGFTHHRKPPSNVGDNDVLIQVWAVGVDDVDRRLVCPMPAEAGAVPSSEPSVGWVPGRSVVGRVVEVGAHVKDDVCRRGDWVAGLLDLRKGGGLTEFALVERHKVMRVSHPVEARDETDEDEAQRHHASHTLEELALLPLCGVPAYRAFRTFVTSFDTKEKPTVLILRGEEGAGSLVGQALAKLGWRVVVHCRLPENATPRSSQSGHSTPWSSQEGLDSASVSSLPSWMCCDPEILEARVKRWGAERIVFGSELDVLARFAADKSPDAAFDGILDTVGGKDIWQASEKLLRSSSSSTKGHRQLFTTLVGDNPSQPIPSNRSNFLSSVRSWGRDGDGKVGYVWLSIAQDLDWEGRDIRDALGAVANGGALGEGVRPWVGGSVPLDRAMGLFDGVGSVVARVV